VRVLCDESSYTPNWAENVETLYVSEKLQVNVMVDKHQGMEKIKDRN